MSFPPHTTTLGPLCFKNISTSLKHKKAPTLVRPGQKSFAWYTQQVRLDLLIPLRYKPLVLKRLLKLLTLLAKGQSKAYKGEKVCT